MSASLLWEGGERRPRGVGAVCEPDSVRNFPAYLPTPSNVPIGAGVAMGTQKPRILPWLIEQLDSRRLEGVSWVDQSRSRFRIPWKHGLRQDAQPQDFSIFQVREARGAGWVALGLSGLILGSSVRTQQEYGVREGR